jgi:hypothetical protein
VGLADDVLRLLAKRPRLRVELLCDGAPEMWNLLAAEFDRQTFGRRHIHGLVDFWHTVEKLAAAAKVIAPEDADKTRARWKLRLLNASSARAEILDELQASGAEHVVVGDANHRPVHDAITYLVNNAGRMDYARARKLGLPIGSGNVEATCKSLVNLRMNRSGFPRTLPASGRPASLAGRSPPPEPQKERRQRQVTPFFARGTRPASPARPRYEPR